MTNSSPYGARYRTGGVITTVGAAEEHLLLSIDEFFGSSRLADGAGNHDIAFEFATTDLPVWTHPQPSEAGTVYDCPLFGAYRTESFATFTSMLLGKNDECPKTTMEGGQNMTENHQGQWEAPQIVSKDSLRKVTKTENNLISPPFDPAD